MSGVLTLALLGALSPASLAAVRGDFNGDGFADLAIGVPTESFQGQGHAGVLHILYGSNAGLQAIGVGGPASQLWSQASPGVLGALEPADNFGLTLAVGDFNGDGFTDLAVGVPLRDVQGQSASGAVQVLYGSTAGLQATGVGGPAAQFWSQASPGVAGGPETSDVFGNALAVGDFNGDGFADLAIGARGESFQGQDGAGVVHILYGSSAGLQATGARGPAAQLWSQASPGVAGTPETHDAFGRTLAVGDFNADGFADLAIGVPQENDGIGVVHILYGSNAGLQATGVGGPEAQLWSQASPGVAGGPEPTAFGGALAAGDFNADGFADLAIGAPSANVQGQDRAGVVHILYGSNAGLQATGVGGPAAQLWSQASPGVAGAPESGDVFGGELAVGDFNGDGFADLAIGAPDEGVQCQCLAGVVHILYGSNAGLQATGVGGPPSQLWSQASPGVAGAPEFDEFGWSLAVGDFNGDGFADLAIGAPQENAGTGVVHILYGSNAGLQATGVGGPPSQLWSQASPGVAGGPEVGDLFGWALGSQ